MARYFDGANDNLNFGSAAAIDDSALKSMLMWLLPIDNNLNPTNALVAKSDGAVTPTGWMFLWKASSGVSTGHLEFNQDRAVTDGTWVSPNNSVPFRGAGGAPAAVAAVYDRGAVANDAAFYVNSTSQAVTETSPPNGVANSDAAQNMRAGEDDGGGKDLTGSLGFAVYDNTLLTAADVNRHRWWGMAPGGPSTADVVLPMWTDDLKNKGTAGAAADATATGTQMAVGDLGTGGSVEINRVERCYGSMMGCGR